MKLSQVLSKVISLSRKVRKYYDVELPKWHPDYPLVRPGDPDPPAPKEKSELTSYLATLPAEMVFQLELIADLGRLYFGADRLAENYRELKLKYGTPERAAAHLVWYVPLADCLTDGLSELKRHRISVDALPLEVTEEAKA